MPTQKIDPKVIFASDAPSIDKPPVFSDKTKGWDVARANDGRPEIKQMNKMQQDTDLKILWLNENAVLPYDASIDYPDGAVAIKDGSFKQLSSGSWVEFLDDFADKDAVKRGIANRYDSSLTYNSGERVVLANGDIVKSTIAGNTNDPNVDMTGWVNHEEAQRTINNKTIGRFLSSFGAIPDDPAYAEFNEQCLFTAMQSGDVIVDDYYYIKPTATRLINSPVSIYSRSLDSKGTLNFTAIIAGGWLAFGSIDYFKIDGVRVISPAGITGSLTTVQSDTSLIDLFQLTNNYFSMDARFFYANYSTTVDPTVTRYGINNFKVNSNEFDKPRAWMFITNMPHQLFEFKHNTISNMSALFVNISRGSHSFPGKLKSVMKRAEIEYNTVINDDSFFATGNVVGGYCTPLLYEGGGHCNYRFNHVEGIKTTEDVAVYDCYINTGSLDSFKNTCKNNIGMFSGKTHNMLMKSKGTYKSSYRNNKFIVERDFIERHNAQAVGWVQLYEIDSFAASNSNRFEAVDNEIDVYEIIGQTVASPFLNLIFKSNKIKAKNMTTLLFNVKRNDPAFTDFSNAMIDVSDNEFDVESCGKEISFRGSLISGWGLLRLDTRSALGIHKDLKVNGNTLRLGEVRKAFDFVTGLEADKVQTKDNTLIANSVQVGATFAPFRYTNPNYTLEGDFRGNKVFLLNGSTMAATGTSFNLPASPTKLDIAVNGLFSGWYTNINIPTTKNVNALVTLEHLTNSLIYNASSRFVLSPTGITYTDLAGVQQTAAYPTTGTTNISMKCEQSSAINNVVPSISATLRAAGSTVSINFGVTGLGASMGDYKLKLETFS